MNNKIGNQLELYSRYAAVAVVNPISDIVYGLADDGEVEFL